MIWNCRDRQIEYGKKVLIMGIVNVTPDSFSDGGDHFDADKAVDCALELEAQGADIIDIGAQSTRPDHIPVSDEEEWKRLEPVLKKLNGKLSVPLSVDTYYPMVAEKALEKGADIINDVSGVITEKMAKIVKKSRCGWILMHNGSGSPADVKNFFEKSVNDCISFGVKRSQLCLDMGIGFGKNYDENMMLLTSVADYKLADFPLLLGTSRKRVIGAGSHQDNPKERIYGNIAADTVAIIDGVDIIRLHDVKNEKQGILMAQELKKYRSRQ
ncbi:MAG: dihydropteroate synthase [Acetobacter sp.]|nr:dihydropteroate synthase [Bacteroides sp.]MCM1340368.1 dihydropteroate synthase [Acetobacter sp.]MCM1432985.1 dihydropteroate synthase [Clostridiales bacterium]